MPIVTLRHRATGRVVRFANFHNPADTYGPAQRLRNKARRIEVRLARKLSRKGHLVLTGDMNETKRYFCHMTGQAPMHAAIFGRHKRGRCVPPKRMEIDWVFGSPQVKFPRARIAEGRMVSKTSDHAMVIARTKIRRSAR
jgi:endonuclease/exonuclease/phosphatase family metal-dependent hydrolase